jgi:hypothetical protein
MHRSAKGAAPVAAGFTLHATSPVDEWLIGQLPTWRTEGNIVIDSHPVTKEVFGFRITPFSLDQVRRIEFDAIPVLVGEPNTFLHGRPGECSYLGPGTHYRSVANVHYGRLSGLMAAEVRSSCVPDRVVRKSALGVKRHVR